MNGLARYRGLCAILIAAGCADHSLPEPGTIRKVRLLGPRGANESVMSADDRFILFCTTGPGASLVVTDLELRVVEEYSHGPYRLAAARGSPMALCYWPLRLKTLSIPKCDVTQRCDMDAHSVLAAATRDSSGHFCHCGDGWVVVATHGEVLKLDGNLRVSGTGRAAMGDVSAVAMDDPRNTLVIAGDAGQVEAYDMGAMESKGRCAVGSGIDCSAWAGDGVAWVATRTGVAQIDTEALVVRSRTVVAEGRQKTSVRLDVSASGRTMAVCCSSADGRGPRNELRVFKIAPEGAEEVGSISAELDGQSANDVTIVEKMGLVIVSTPVTVWVWNYKRATSGE